MTASIATNTTRPTSAITLNVHMDSKRPLSPTNTRSQVNMAHHCSLEEDTDFADTTHHEPAHHTRRDDVTVDVKDGPRGPSSSLPTSRYPTSEFGKLVFGASGIYLSFLFYGSLQEDVFKFKGDGGQKFVYAWWLQFVEAGANVLVGFIGQQQEQQQQSSSKTATTSPLISNGIFGLGKTVGSPNSHGKERLPLSQFFASGASQVISKACTSLALANGLSFPVATLAKSGKMAPVMMGQLLLGGSHYVMRDYLQVLAIIAGTVLLSMGKNPEQNEHDSDESQSTWAGAVFILLSLAMDGMTAGFQKKLQADLARRGISAHPYDFMLYTNVSMMSVALLIGFHEFRAAWTFCWLHPRVWALVLSFSICSAIGQSFIFYTVAHFDPLVCSTITTTRKMASVFFSIFVKGHNLSTVSWIGIGLALGGVASEIQAKMAQRRKIKSAT